MDKNPPFLKKWLYSHQLHGNIDNEQATNYFSYIPTNDLSKSESFSVH